MGKWTYIGFGVLAVLALFFFSSFILGIVTAIYGIVVWIIGLGLIGIGIIIFVVLVLIGMFTEEESGGGTTSVKARCPTCGRELKNMGGILVCTWCTPPPGWQP